MKFVKVHLVNNDNDKTFWQSRFDEFGVKAYRHDEPVKPHCTYIVGGDDDVDGFLAKYGRRSQMQIDARSQEFDATIFYEFIEYMHQSMMPEWLR
ncbi:MAG: hypothetical protein LUC22_01355 [Prevotella sp.]|nr:hypothetical protein [Prevotella sp.]